MAHSQKTETLIPPSDTFATRLVQWQKTFGRHDLPWQCTDPYKVWVSELMLQQTQVTTVLKYYTKFLEKFPTVNALANASQDEVYAQWSGLGYYRRARFLHEGAKIIAEKYQGSFPTTVDDLLTLPGVGVSTAHAIASFCYNTKVSILDGNVQRTLSRWAGLQEEVSSTASQKKLWDLATGILPLNPMDMPSYTQGLMDFGATVCTPKNPSCDSCPFTTECKTKKMGLIDEIPKKKEKKTTPERTYVGEWHVNALGEIGFSQYRQELGVWENLYGPQFQLSEKPENPLFHVKHIFSHFKGHFYLVKASDTSKKESLTWKTKEQWLKSGVPTPVRKILDVLN